jgi:hypothetical protein
MPINVNGNEINSVGAKVIADGGLVTTGLTNVWDFGLNTCYPGSGTSLSTLTTSTQAWTLTNGPTYSTLGGGSLLFDGSNDYLAYTNAGSYSLSGAYTMYFWIKTSNPDGGLHSHYSGGPVNHAMRLSSGKLSHSYYNTTWRDNYGTGTSVNTNNWTMVTYAMVSGAGTQTTYVNGVADWTFTVTGGHGGANAGSIGSLWGYGYFGGYMGQVIEYNGVTHTAAQVLQTFNATRQRYGV